MAIRKSVYEGYVGFLSDEEKMHDFLTLSMEEFLFTYSYLSVEEYYATYDAVMDLVADCCELYDVFMGQLTKGGAYGKRG